MNDVYTVHLDTFSLAPLTQVELCPPNKKKTNMCYECGEYDPKVGYLNERIENINCALRDKLEIQFGLSDDTDPKTASEAVERIKAGKYVLPNRNSDYGYRSIIWRDPSVVADKDGFLIAIEAKDKAKTAARDIVMTGTPADGLKAVQDFEAWTYTPAASAPAA